MTGIEVSCFSVTSKAKAYRIIKGVRTAIGFLNDVMNVDASAAELVTHATPTVRLD
jgi:hypothetical protein